MHHGCHSAHPWPYRPPQARGCVAHTVSAQTSPPPARKQLYAGQFNAPRRSSISTIIQAATAISGDDLQRLKAERLRAEQVVSAIAQATPTVHPEPQQSYTPHSYTLASLEGYRRGTMTPAEPLCVRYYAQTALGRTLTLNLTLTITLTLARSDTKRELSLPYP